MTCIAGYIDKKTKTTYMGADTAGVSGYIISRRKDSKIFSRTNPYGNSMLIGFTGSFRMGQLLRYKLTIPKHIKNIDTYEYMCTYFIDEVKNILTENGFTKIVNNQNEIGKFLVAYNQRLFIIDSDLQVGESQLNYNACGSGGDIALASMRTLDNYSKENYSGEAIINTALQVSEDFCSSVRKPFVILSLKEEDNV